MNRSSSDTIWTRNFILLCLANFSFFIALQQLLPTLPVYLLDIGGSQSDVGYAMGSYTIGAMIMRPLAGWLVDSYGRKKALVAGMALVIIVTLFYPLASNVSSVILIRGLHGLFYGLAGTAIGTMVADSLPSARLGEGMGYFGLTSALSMAMAPMIGFWLVGSLGYNAMFMAVSILTVLAFFWCLPVRETSEPSGSPPPSITGIVRNLFESTALPSSGVTFFLAGIYGAVLSFVALHGVEQGVANIGFFFMSMAITMIISRPISGRWSDAGGTAMVLLIGHLTMAFGMIVLAFSHSSNGFLFSGGLIGAAFGFCLPTLQALAVRSALPHRRGAATGTFFVALDLGIGLGTILWGYAAQAVGYQMMYLITLVPLAMAGAFCCRFIIRLLDKPGADL